MKSKNIARYKDEFSNIIPDEYLRIMKFIKEKKLSEKDMQKVSRKIAEISSIPSSYIKIVFDIIPEATPRPRLGIAGRFYVKNANTNNEFIRYMVEQDRDLYHLITTPCKIVVNNYFPIPSALNRVDSVLAELGMIEMISKPDWDNLGKTYSDMVQKWILQDDSLIVSGTSNKFYSLKPRVEIIIEYKHNHSCKYNEKKMSKYSTPNN